jgi:branched-chain amino acid transport system substrate-binding protein
MSNHRPIQIGVLYSQTGVTASVETTQQQATLLAIDEINQRGGVLGRELRPICLDPASQPRRCASLSEQLILEHGVRLIMGCYMSSTRKAVIPIVERHNALLFYATPYEGFEFSRNVFYAGAAPNQNILPLADYMLSRHGLRVAMVGSDYVCPYEANRVMSDLIYERGGQKALEAYLPLDAEAAAYETVAASIQTSGVDFIFSTVVGAGATALHRALARHGLDPARLPIASHMASETDMALIGAEWVEGLITCASYFQSIDNAVNRDAVRRHQARHGADRSTNACWEAAYFQMHLLARAIERAGSDDPTRVALAMPGLEYDAPQGRVRVDAHNNHTELTPRIGRCDRHGQFEILAEAPQRVAADPYGMSHRTPGWTRAAADDAADSLRVGGPS